MICTRRHEDVSNATQLSRDLSWSRPISAVVGNLFYKLLAPPWVCLAVWHRRTPTLAEVAGLPLNHSSLCSKPTFFDDLCYMVFYKAVKINPCRVTEPALEEHPGSAESRYYMCHNIVRSGNETQNKNKHPPQQKTEQHDYCTYVQSQTTS